MRIFSRENGKDFFQIFSAKTQQKIRKITQFGPLKGNRGMQFGIGILIKMAMSKGGVHKLQIFIRQKPQENFKNI